MYNFLIKHNNKTKIYPGKESINRTELIPQITNNFSKLDLMKVTHPHTHTTNFVYLIFTKINSTFTSEQLCI